MTAFRTILVCVIVAYVNVTVILALHRKLSNIPTNQLRPFNHPRNSSTSQIEQSGHSSDISNSHLGQLRYSEDIPNSQLMKFRNSKDIHISQDRYARDILDSQQGHLSHSTETIYSSEYSEFSPNHLTQGVVEANNSTSSGTTKMFDLFDTQNLGDYTRTTSPYLEMVKIIQDEVARLNLTSDGVLQSPETIQAMLGLRWDRVFKRVLASEPIDMLFPQPSNVSPACYQNLLGFIRGLVGVDNGAGNFATEDWALKMLDAFGKPSAGLMQGVFQWIGNYEECLNTQARIELPRQYVNDITNDTVNFNGKYCRVVINAGHIVKVALSEHINQFWRQKPTFPVVVNWGVCVPNSCKSEDIFSFLTQGSLASLRVPIKKVVCFEESRFSEDTRAITAMVILCTIIAVVAFCTFLDIYYYRPWQSNDVRREMGNGEDRQGVAGMLEMQGRNGELRSDASQFTCHDQGMTDISSRDHNGHGGYLVKQMTLSHTSCPDKSTLSADAKETKKKEMVLQESNRAKSQDEKEDTPHHVMPRISTRDNDNLDTGSRDAIQIRRAVKSRRKVIGEQLIQGMSLYRNLHCLLFKTRSQGTFDCIEGMRVISLAWIVVGHCYTYGGMLDANNLIFENSAELVETSARLSFHIVGSAHLAVDTFFMISGCLTMLITLRLLRRRKPGIKFWLAFLFHRFWRLTPLYMVVMVVGMTLYDHVVQGPLKSDDLAEFTQCGQKWWSHLLYINNFYKPYSKCMTWSWFMAVDMQLFLISPVFIYGIHRNIKVGIGLILSLLVFGMMSAFVSEYVHGGQFVLMDLSFLNYWSYVYTMPWARASVFGVGLILGVILQKQLGRPRISKRIGYCVWLVVTVVTVFLVLINHNQWKHDSQNWTRVQQSFYESLVRPGWAVCMAWVIFACCSDLGGYANVVLGWRPFLVLSRLTYSLYLLHPMVILFVVYSRRTTIYLDPANLSLVYNYIGNLVFTFLLGAIFSLFFEMPMSAMENILLRSH